MFKKHIINPNAESRLCILITNAVKAAFEEKLFIWTTFHKTLASRGPEKRTPESLPIKRLKRLCASLYQHCKHILGPQSLKSIMRTRARYLEPIMCQAIQQINTKLLRNKL